MGFDGLGDFIDSGAQTDSNKVYGLGLDTSAKQFGVGLGKSFSVASVDFFPGLTEVCSDCVSGLKYGSGVCDGWLFHNSFLSYCPPLEGAYPFAVLPDYSLCAFGPVLAVWFQASVVVFNRLNGLLGNADRLRCPLAS